MKRREKDFDHKMWEKRKSSKENAKKKSPNTAPLNRVNQDFSSSYNEHNEHSMYRNYDSARSNLKYEFIVVWQEHHILF